LKGETIYSLNREVVQNQIAKLKVLRGSEDFNEHITRVEKEARRMSGFRNPDDFGKAVFSGRYAKKEYLLEKYLVPGSGDYMLPVALFIPVENRKGEVVFLLDDQGMEQMASSDSLLIHSMVKQGYSVLLFDVPGIGSLGPGYLRGDAYIDNTSYNQWFAGIHTNKSLVGMRAEDIIRITHFIKTDCKDTETIIAISKGPMGSEVLHAAVFNDAIKRVCLVEPFLSFADIALSREYLPAYIPSTVAGAINHYDLPDLMAALSSREILIVNPLTANGDPAGDETGLCRMTYPKIVFTQKGAKNRFKHAAVGEGQSVIDQIIQWLE
jgi:hypothetical protein